MNVDFTLLPGDDRLGGKDPHCSPFPGPSPLPKRLEGSFQSTLPSRPSAQSLPVYHPPRTPNLPLFPTPAQHRWLLLGSRCASFSLSQDMGPNGVGVLLCCLRKALGQAKTPPTPAPSLCLIILGWGQRGPSSHTLLSSPDPQIKETFGRYGEVAPSPGPPSSIVTPSGTMSLVTMPQHPRIFPKQCSNCPLTLQSQGKGLGGHFWVAGMGGRHPRMSAEHRPPGAQKLAKRQRPAPPPLPRRYVPAPPPLRVWGRTSERTASESRPPAILPVLACSWEEARSP